MSDGRTFYSFHGELLSKNMAQEDNSRDGRHASAIWSFFADVNSVLSPKRPDKDALSILNF